MAKPKRWRGVSPNTEKPYAWQSIAAMARALEVTNCPQGLAAYVALSICEARAPKVHKGKFFTSEEEIARWAGLSARRLRPYLKKLEAAQLVLRYRPVGKAKLNNDSSMWTITSYRPDEKSCSQPDVSSGSERTHSDAKTSDIKEYPLPKAERILKNKAARPSAVASGASPSADAGLAPATAAGLEERSPFGHLSDEARKFMEGEE